MNNTINADSRLKMRTKIGYSFGQVTDSIGYNFYYFFFMYFLTDFAGLNPALAGSVSLIAIIWDAVSDPIIGNISDNIRSSRGRRRPLMLCSIAPYMACLILLFSTINAGDTGKFAYYVILAMFFWTCYTSFVIPYNALGGEITSDFDERTTLRSYASVFIMLSVMVASAAPPLVLEFAMNMGFEGVAAWRIVAMVFAVLVGIAGIITWATTKGGELIDKEPETINKIEKQNLFKSFIAILKLKPVLILCGTVILWNMATCFVSSGGIYALTSIFRVSSTTQSAVFFVQTGMGIVWIPVINYIAHKFDKKTAYWVTMGITGAVMLAFTFIGLRSLAVWIGYVIIFAFGNTAFWTLYYSLMYDIYELDEFKTGFRREGIIAAMMSFFQKLGAALTTQIMGLVLAWGKYDGAAAVQCDSALDAIQMLVTLLPAICGILAAVLAFIHPITKTRYTALSKALELKRAGKEYSTDGFKELL